jgi:hypothetical protein
VTGLLTEVGKKLTDRWLSLLVLPGLLFIGILAAAWLLSVRAWATPQERGAVIGDLDRTLVTADSSSGRAIAILVAALLLSAVAGLGAQVLGTVSRWMWLARAPLGTVLDFAMRRRRAHWKKLDQRSAECTDPTLRLRLVNRRNRMALTEPASPTWMGDRMAGLAVRIRNAYGLDLATAWPRLRLLLPEDARKDTQAATDAFERASVHAGWGLLYTLAGAVFAARAWSWWWPLLLVGVGTYATGWFRGRAAIRELSTTIESIMDIYARLLLKSEGPGEPSPADGERLSEYFRKGA